MFEKYYINWLSCVYYIYIFLGIVLKYKNRRYFFLENIVKRFYNLLVFIDNIKINDG